MASQALTTTFLLLLAAPCAFCGKMSSENKDACLQEATASSSVSEEDREKAMEINKQVRKEMRQMFKEKGAKEAIKELKGRDMTAEKVDGAEDIKDKEAAKNFLKAFEKCIRSKFAMRGYDKCQKAKEVNNDRLTGEELSTMIATMMKAHKESEGTVSEEDIEKKLTEALGSEEKAKVAMEVKKALQECATEFKSMKAAKKE
ncbi:hypothetical protein V5799_007138 [Amblyomma americanum]|uniref:Secreted protein n=1 Tax=Amblyomma americanum TaxID=6943 RepID=A0AAQ4DUE0_AMBAM